MQGSLCYGSWGYNEKNWWAQPWPRITRQARNTGHMKIITNSRLGMNNAKSYARFDHVDLLPGVVCKKDPDLTTNQLFGKNCMDDEGNMADTSASERISLKWDYFSNNLTSGFLSHLSNNDLVDVTLAVEGKLFQAHKLVLSVCSPYFRDIFQVNPCPHPVVILRDMRYTEVELLLRFMYQGEVNVRQGDLAAFLKVAEVLKIKGLTGESDQCDPHDHDSSSTDRSESQLPLENMETDGCSNEEKTRNSFEANLPSNRTTVVNKAIFKRPPEATVSNSPTNKRCRILSTLLEEMSIPTRTPEQVTTKDEPLDFYLPDDEVALVEEPLENSLILNHVLRQDALNYFKNGQYSSADRRQQPSKSLKNLSWLQGDIIQKKINRSHHPRLHLGGYIYYRTHDNKEGINWRCRLYENTKCSARSITAAGVILRKIGTHNHKPETCDMSAYYSQSGEIVPLTAQNSTMNPTSSSGVEFPLI